MKIAFICVIIDRFYTISGYGGGRFRLRVMRRILVAIRGIEVRSALSNASYPRTKTIPASSHHDKLISAEYTATPVLQPAGTYFSGTTGN